MFCLDEDMIQEDSMTRTYYYDMNDEKDAAQCRFNWNWEVNNLKNNPITGPYPILGVTQPCSGY